MPRDPDAEQLRMELVDLAALEAFAAHLAATAPTAALVRLEGDLGAGKTSLVRALLRALGFTGTVRSPTYTLLEPYTTARHQCAHLDLYRLADAEELEYLGFRDLLREPRLIFVEWPERAAGYLPTGDLTIHFDFLPQGRALRLEPSSPAGINWVSALRTTPAT